MTGRPWLDVGEDGPVSPAWILWHLAISAMAGVLSIPSTGPPAALVALFLASAIVGLVGLFAEHLHSVMVALGLAVVACGGRTWAIWQTDQHGAGGQYIASATWALLAIGNVMEFYAVSERGIRRRR